MPALTAELHTGAPTDLLGGWEELYAGQPDATPFMSPGWARAWQPHYGADAEPFTWCVREGGILVGLAPLVIRRRGPARVVEPVGMEPGDYWDVLAVAERRHAVAEAFAAGLAEHAGRWDSWILRCLVPGSPVVDALATSGLTSLVRPPIAAPAIELPDSFDAYLAGLSGSHRQNLRKHLRRLDNGDVELDEVSDASRLPDVIARWQDFRRRQWDSAGKDINPEHLSPRFAAFMLDVMGELVPTGEGLAWEFKVGGDVVGTYLNFVDGESFHWYLGGFDPAVTNLGLGKIAIGHGIRTSIEAGRRRYDFGRGAEPYKYWYGAVDRPLVARVVGSSRPRSRLALAGAKAVLSRRG